MAVHPQIAPVPSNAPSFAHEFTKHMRARKDVMKKPSVRQTQSIAQLLSARYFRNGELTLEDFREAAIFTSYPADQDIAREVAEDILLGRNAMRKQKKPDQAEAELVGEHIKSDQLSEVMDQIRREQELRKVIEKEKVEAGYEYLKELRSRKNKNLHNAARDYLSDGDIVLRGITNDKELKKTANQMIEERYGGLTSQDIKNSQTLDSLDDVCESSNSAERLAAKSLRGDEDVMEEFSKLTRQDPATAARSLRHMEEMGTLDQATQKQMDKMLQDNLNDLSEAADYARELKRVNENLDKKIQGAPSKYQLADAASFGDKIREHSGTSRRITDALLQQYDQQYHQNARSKVDMHELSNVQSSSASWRSLVKKETQSTLDDAKTRSSPTDFLESSLGQAVQLKGSLESSVAKTEWDTMQQKFADAAVDHSATKTDLRNTVKTCSNFGQVPSEQSIRGTGKRIGMTENEILELLNPSFDVIKKLIQAGVDDFDRLHTLVSSAALSEYQLRQLADLATEKGNQNALGAIAHEDFGSALGMQSRGGYRYRGSPLYGVIDQKRADMAIGGLLGGPATNVIRIWFSYRDELPPKLKQRLRDIAKRLLIDLGMRIARATMGSSMLGGIQESTTVRPFRVGDDVDLIDLEETIEALLVQGRTNFKIIEDADFLVTETYQGHRAFYWALDKSGSMDAPEKLGMLAISVMAGLYGVQKDDFGVVLFDNQTHIVKQISERNVSVEKVASELLDARAGGGTKGASSIELALRNFEETKAKEKVFIFSTDMYLSDEARCEELAERMKPLGIKMIILVPKASYSAQAARTLAGKAHGVVLDIADINELPARLLGLTNY